MWATGTKTGGTAPFSQNSFALGQMDLYITSRLTDHLGVVMETVFEAEPNNSLSVDVERFLLHFYAMAMHTYMRATWPTPESADTDKGKPNRAKAEIWQEMPKFRAAADKMIGEVAKLDIAAKTGNLEQIKSAVGAVGQSCKACHDNFRAERK